MSNNPTPPAVPTQGRFHRFLERTQHLAVRSFHAYGSWLTRQSWWRFTLYSLLLLIISAILAELPPFSWQIGWSPSARTPRSPGRTAPAAPASTPIAPAPPSPPASSNAAPSARSQKPGRGLEKGSLLTLKVQDTADSDSQEMKETLMEVQSALEEIQTLLESANLPPGLIRIETNGAPSSEEGDGEDEPEEDEGPAIETLGELLPNLALLMIFVSIPLKIAYQGQQRAQAAAAQAVQTAENETLRRQIMEARLAAMQAQIEPYFLFNTLGSIEHLIETDPARAGRMQRSLIAFLREAMPTIRETQANTLRNLGRELAIVTPYLELLKMRMEERLRAEIRIPSGLMSAEFPPMMLQSLVENAIRHGLEPRRGRIDHTRCRRGGRSTHRLGQRHRHRLRPLEPPRQRCGPGQHPRTPQAPVRKQRQPEDRLAGLGGIGGQHRDPLPVADRLLDTPCRHRLPDSFP